jgi:membrane-bound serine protease (ClpP class)
MKKFLLLWLCSWLFIGLVVGRVAPVAADEARQVLVLRFSGPVTPAMLSYLERGLQEAEAMGAEAVVFALDTPGGSVDITRRIVQTIEQSSVPVIVYVSPARAWAASAGTLITLAGHLAAMAPETLIGAASPVAVGGEELPETAQAKAEQALAAMARSLATRRGEAVVRWAAETVTAATASTAEEALAIGAIDVIAPDLRSLFEQLDGARVMMPDGERVLHLAGAEPVEFEPNFFEQFLAVLSNPVVAAILLTLGLNALLYELSAPGGYVAGAIGIIALLLAFYSLGTLEANWAVLAFITVAFALFAVELKAHSGGILTVAGLVSFVIGTAMLFNTPYYPIPWAAIIGLAAAMGLFVAVALRLVQANSSNG